MYAIVEIAGKQFRVAKEQNLKVPRLEADSGSKIQFDKVLFYSDDKGKTQVGKPDINNLAVSATVVEHGRDKKIIVFKKKRRKGYQVKNGHRQGFSVIKIDDIGVLKKGSAPAKKEEKETKPAPKAKSETAAKPKTATKKTAETKTGSASKSKTTAAKKSSSTKKTTTKKSTSTAKKEPAKKTAKKSKTKEADAKDNKKASEKKKEA